MTLRCCFALTRHGRDGAPGPPEQLLGSRTVVARPGVTELLDVVTSTPGRRRDARHGWLRLPRYFPGRSRRAGSDHAVARPSTMTDVTPFANYRLLAVRTRGTSPRPSPSERRGRCRRCSSRPATARMPSRATGATRAEPAPPPDRPSAAGAPADVGDATATPPRGDRITAGIGPVVRTANSWRCAWVRCRRRPRAQWLATAADHRPTARNAERARHRGAAAPNNRCTPRRSPVLRVDLSGRLDPTAASRQPLRWRLWSTTTSRRQGAGEEAGARWHR